MAAKSSDSSASSLASNDSSPSVTSPPAPGFDPSSFKGCSKGSKGEGSIKRRRDADMLLEKLNRLLEMLVEELKERMKEREERREWRKKRKITTDEQAPSVADALAKINSMPDLVSEAPVFSFARSMMIRDPNKRIILMCLPNDTSRLLWIKYLYDKMQKGKTNFDA